MSRASDAAKLRELARQVADEPTGVDYSCDKIYRAFGGRYGHPIHKGYGDLFMSYSNPNEAQELWNMPKYQVQNMRVLLLCFAAALVETGDLHL